MSVDSIIDPQPPDSALVVAGLIPMALVLIILKAAYMKLKHVGDVLDVSMLQHGAVVASATGVGTSEGGRSSFGVTSSPGGEGRGNALEERLLQLPSQERKSDSEGSSGVGLFSSLFRGKPGKNPFESASVATGGKSTSPHNKGGGTGAVNSSSGGSRTLRIPVEDHPIDSLSPRKSEKEQQEANVRDLNQVTHLWLKPPPISGSEDDDKSFRKRTQQHSGVGGVGTLGGSTNLGAGTTLSSYPTSAEGGFDPLISRRIPLLGGGDANDRGEEATPATTSSSNHNHHHHDNNSDRLLDVPMRRYTSSLLPSRGEEGKEEDNNIREEGQDQQQQSSLNSLQGYNPLGPLTFGRNPLGGPGGMQQQQQAIVTSPTQPHDRNAPPKRGVSATGYSNRQRSTSPKFNPYL